MCAWCIICSYEGWGGFPRQRRGHQSPIQPTLNISHCPTYLVTVSDYPFHSVLIRATGNWLLHPGTISTEMGVESIWMTGHLGGEEGHCVVTPVRSVARRWRWRSPDWYLIVTIVISLEALCPSSPLSDHRFIHNNKSFVNVDPVNQQHPAPWVKHEKETRNYCRFWD